MNTTIHSLEKLELKRLTMPGIGEGLELLELSCTVEGNVK